MGGPVSQEYQIAFLVLLALGAVLFYAEIVRRNRSEPPSTSADIRILRHSSTHVHRSALFTLLIGLVFSWAILRDTLDLVAFTILLAGTGVFICCGILNDMSCWFAWDEGGIEAGGGSGAPQRFRFHELRHIWHNDEEGTYTLVFAKGTLTLDDTYEGLDILLAHARTFAPDP